MHSSANGDLKLILFIAVALWLCQIFQTLQENRVPFQSTHRASHSAFAFFAGGATGCFSYALLAIVMMHVLRPDYTPINHFQFLTLHRGAPYGIANRLFVSLLFAWLLTTSIHLLKVARQ